MVEIELKSKKKRDIVYKAIVDDEDYDLVKHFTWYAKVYPNRNVVYARAYLPGVDGKSTSVILHRLILGTIDAKTLVDHENGNGLDCRRQNLR